MTSDARERTDAEPSPAPRPSAPPPRRRRSAWRLFAWSLVALVMLAGAALVGGYQWLTRTPAGLATILRIVDFIHPGKVVATNLSGSLRDGFAADELRVIAGTTEVTIRRLSVRIADWSFTGRYVQFDELAAERVAVRLAAPPPTPPGADTREPPDAIAMPVLVDAIELRVGEFALEREGAVAPFFTMHAVDASVAFGPHGTAVRDLDTEIAGNRLVIAGTLGPRRPFALEAGGTLSSRLTVGADAREPATIDAPVQATFRLSDSLERIVAHAGITGGPGYAARGSLRLVVTPFAPVATRELDADIEGIDPKAWLDAAPAADLQVSASLKPGAGTDFSLAGPVRIVNRRPGPIDSQRLPVRELQASLAVTTTTLQLESMRVALDRGAVQGRVALDWTARGKPPRWNADLRLDGVDPAAIDTRAQPLRLDGRVAATGASTAAGAATRVQADVRARAIPGVPTPLRLEAVATIDAARIAVERARLQLDRGHAELAGELGLRDPRAFSVRGTMQDIDPGVIAKGVAARINGEVAAEGALAPTPNATLRATLVDSELQGRPLRGRVQLDWRGDDALDTDAELLVRSASLRIRGGLGATPDSTRELHVALEAPALDELGVPVRGAASVRATLSGAWRAPAIVAESTARNLVAAGQRVGELTARVRYGGGSDGALDATIALADHQHPRGAAVSVARADVAIHGTLGNHEVRLDANSAEDAPLAARARGGWRAATSTWDGRVESADLGAPFDVRLVAPAPLAIALDHGAFGPAALQVKTTRVHDGRVAWRAGALETSGRFDALTIRTGAIEGAEPLTLRGEWDLRAAQALDGRLLVERSAGDIHTGTATRRARMGLTELRAEAVVRANRLSVQASLRGTEAGVVRATLNAQIENSPDAGWRLAQTRPWSGELDADAPSIAWINPFLSANLRDSVRVGGAFAAKLRLSGTPAVPRASGTLDGEKLRVAWIEQGLRLNNGTLHARLVTDDGGESSFVLDELSFTDTPRLVPDDRRITQVVQKDAVGRLHASGRVGWPTLDGVVQVRFERFPLIQRRDRWLIVTGGANAVFSPRLAQLNGSAVANAGYIDISRPTAPTLSSDVTVVRPSVEPERKPAPGEPRFVATMQLTTDLGPAFILRGNGIDTRITGALAARHDGKALRVTGALEAQDGVFEGYGQKLAIERGRVTFQGPADNPGLDILALRKNLPVDVGVTITRTAANPLVRLYSDPPMADIETLSWLVFGRPTADTRGDNAALARAALGLLGGTGEGIPQKLARQLGIDEVSIRAADTADSGSLLPRQTVAGRLRSDTPTVGGEIVSIGKRLSDDLTLSYEQATAGTTSIVQLHYQLTRRFSLIARAGTENALDLVYSIAFD